MVSLLVEIACETDGIVDKCDLVEMASNEYQKREDYLSRFVDEKIEKGSATDKISKQMYKKNLNVGTRLNLEKEHQVPKI